jgi:CheY-like chemotaxis protein
MQDQHTPKILLIDDDVDLILMYTPVLEQAGFTVRSAHTSVEGLELFKSFHPDIAVVDLSMEHFDSGFVLCHKIRALPEGEHAHIVILTSAGHDTGFRFTTQTKEEQRWIRADDYLEKPISAVDLLHYLNEKLRKHHATPTG